MHIVIWKAKHFANLVEQFACARLTKTAIWSNHTIIHQNTLVGFNDIPDILWRVDSFAVPIQKENFEIKSIPIPPNATYRVIPQNNNNNYNNNNNK